MTYSKFILLIILISIFSCNPKINQTVKKQREGKWIIIDTLDSIYIAKGKYRNDKEIGTWRYFYNGHMIKNEKYRKSFTKTTFYHSNGKIMKRGKTKTETNTLETHWYYYGKWHFYNKEGKLDSIKFYTKENYNK